MIQVTCTVVFMNLISQQKYTVVTSRSTPWYNTVDFWAINTFNHVIQQKDVLVSSNQNITSLTQILVQHTPTKHQMP